MTWRGTIISRSTSRWVKCANWAFGFARRSPPANLRSLIAADTAPDAPFPISISEFNTHTGATFDGKTNTLDSPTEYPLLGAIAVNLMANG